MMHWLALSLVLVVLGGCAQLTPKPDFYPTKGARNTTVHVDSKTSKEVVVYDLTGDWDAHYLYGPEIVRIVQKGNYIEGIRAGNETHKGQKAIQGEIDGNLIDCATAAYSISTSTFSGFVYSTGKISNDGDRFECLGPQGMTEVIREYNRRR